MRQDTTALADVRAVALDMDGVLWRGSELLPGVHAFFDFLQGSRVPFVLVTNNSTRTVDMYVEKLARLGLDVSGEQIITSAVATAAYLRANYSTGTRVHVVGESGLHEIVAEAGFPPVMRNADVVVVGMDRDLTYAKLRHATLFIRGGAHFIGTNGDRTFPTPEGLAPGAGTILAALQASTDQQPLVIGKPEPVMFEMALARLGTSAADTLMVGDRLETDILGAQRAGLRTALVLTGVTSPETLASGDVQPDWVFDHLDALRAVWESIVRIRGR